MLVKYQTLSTQLKKKKFPFYLVTGEDPFLMDDAACQIKKALAQQHPDIHHNILSINTPSDWDSFLTEANSYSLLQEYTLLDVRFEKKTIDKLGKKQITAYLENINPCCYVLLQAPQAAKQLQWLSKHENVLTVQIYPFSEAEFIAWLKKQLQKNAIHISPEAPAIIHQYTQGNLLAAHQLIEKLSLLPKQQEQISEKTILSHLTDQSNFQLFQLTEACLQNDLSKSLRVFRKTQSSDITLLLWLLTNEIRQCLLLHEALKQGASFIEACKKLKIWASRAQLYKNKIDTICTETLSDMLSKCQKLDMLIRSSINSHQVGIEFERLMMRFCGVNYASH